MARRGARGRNKFRKSGIGGNGKKKKVRVARTKRKKDKGKKVKSPDWFEKGQASVEQFTNAVGMAEEKFNQAVMIFEEAKGGVEKTAAMVSKFGDVFTSFKNMSLVKFDFHVAVSKKRISFSSALWVQNYKFLEKKDGSEFDTEEAWQLINGAIADAKLPALIESKNKSYGGPYYFVHKIGKNATKGLYAAIQDIFDECKEKLEPKQKFKTVFGKKIPVPGTSEKWNVGACKPNPVKEIEIDNDAEEPEE